MFSVGRVEGVLPDGLQGAPFQIEGAPGQRGSVIDGNAYEGQLVPGRDHIALRARDASGGQNPAGVGRRVCHCGRPAAESFLELGGARLAPAEAPALGPDDRVQRVALDREDLGCRTQRMSMEVRDRDVLHACQASVGLAYRSLHPCLYQRLEGGESCAAPLLHVLEVRLRQAGEVRAGVATSIALVYLELADERSAGGLVTSIGTSALLGHVRNALQSGGTRQVRCDHFRQLLEGREVGEVRGRARSTESRGEALEVN